jgi:hypothetical protein
VLPVHGVPALLPVVLDFDIYARQLCQMPIAVHSPRFIPLSVEHAYDDGVTLRKLVKKFDVSSVATSHLLPLEYGSHFCLISSASSEFSRRGLWFSIQSASA